jgi:hypothetical protein
MSNLTLFTTVLQMLPWDSTLGPIVFLYFGPETVIPLTSILAGIIGAVLVFWRYIVVMVRKLFKRMYNREEAFVEPVSDFEADA